ncbi:peptidase M4 family protein [Nakamurella sp. YIM 132087]|uniref:Neutral metalloproteinase n=1 Tax=Nakamurella alba TaxID=2665158 RepID=A0A7K1FKZ2_9ACTN|nr:M4 family metallopeptidase [Nakamurella alba]MTD14778.1 peptidase M4 family protein [Nakamurella alba]
MGHLNCILPPDLLLRVIRDSAAGAPGLRQVESAVLRTVELDGDFRARRAQLASLLPQQRPAVAVAPGGTPTRRIHDQQHSTAYEPGVLVRGEGDDPVDDVSVNQAYDAFGHTYDFFWQVLGRNSIDDAGSPLVGLVHYGTDYDNAFWDGQYMYFGDGDGQTLLDTTAGLDVIGHELSHGVTQYTANLTYQGQSGALNESVSDVFGILVRQRLLGQSAVDADWLIGADVVGPLLLPALRSMKAPGTANKYDNQPATMDEYVETSADNGGVHINSGIPNLAFCTAAMALGGNAWEAPAQIWYSTLTDPALSADADFAAFAGLTVTHAVTAFGDDSAEADAVRAGWDAVKVVPAS